MVSKVKNSINSTAMKCTSNNAMPCQRATSIPVPGSLPSQHKSRQVRNDMELGASPGKRSPCLGSRARGGKAQVSCRGRVYAHTAKMRRFFRCFPKGKKATNSGAYVCVYESVVRVTPLPFPLCTRRILLYALMWHHET